MKKRYSYWTQTIKPEVLAKLEEAGIKGEAAKAILRWERAVTTMRNKVYDYGMAWDTLWEDGHDRLAWDAMELLNGNGGWSYREKPKFYDEWCRYCDVRGWVYDCNLGDAMS